jgi:hypothetical protein
MAAQACGIHACKLRATGSVCLPGRTCSHAHVREEGRKAKKFRRIARAPHIIASESRAGLCSKLTRSDRAHLALQCFVPWLHMFTQPRCARRAWGGGPRRPHVAAASKGRDPVHHKELFQHPGAQVCFSLRQCPDQQGHHVVEDQAGLARHGSLTVAPTHPATHGPLAVAPTKARSPDRWASKPGPLYLAGACKFACLRHLNNSYGLRLPAEPDGSRLVWSV